MTFDDRQHLCRLVDSVNEWMWVEGNHDPDLPEGIPGTPCFEIVLDGIVFRHEPEEGEQRAQVIGHYHPKKRTTIARRRYSGKCFTNSESLFVMPAFGQFDRGLRHRRRRHANAIAQAFASRFYALRQHHLQSVSPPQITGSEYISATTA